MRCAKKCIGILLVAALALPVMMPNDAYAAKKPKLSKKKVELDIGAKVKVKVKNAKGYKLTVKSKKKKVATVSKKGKAAFVVKGKKAGKAKVVCTLKKAGKKVKLKCNVKVLKKTIDVVTGTSVPNITSVPVVWQTAVPTATPEPTVAPFPALDTYSDLPYGYADTNERVTMVSKDEVTYGTGGVAQVYLPADYSADKKYPVLYLFHDTADSETAWEDMAADIIMSNAMAFKRAEEMIVVMPVVTGDNDEEVIASFSNEIMPAVEAKYSVAVGRHNNAVGGYGTGGRIALGIGMKLTDKVAYTGALAPVEGALESVGEANFNIPDEYKETSFVMIQKGSSDDVAGNAPGDYQNALSGNGTECLYLEMDGAHDSELFKAGLYNFVRRLFKEEGGSISNGFVTKVPSSVDNGYATNKGTIEVIEYDTETYDPGRSEKIRKWANVFLPYDYDPNKQYNVLYLMHGGGENADTWIKGDDIYGDYTHNQNMINLLFEQGYCEPCIIVNPTFYRPEGAPEPDDAFDLTILFQYELRNDLIPAVESKYSTYANGDVSIENLKATRMHRGFAGLSMGSNTTYQSAFYGNYDLFAWFAPYSGYFSVEEGEDAEADKFNKVIEEGETNGMPLGFFYCGNGDADFALSGQLEVMERALIKSDVLVPGQNFEFIMIPGGEHNMWQWHIHLYNTLKIFFTKE